MAEQKEYWDVLQERLNKNEDDFDKKILYIGAGALLLSLTLLEKIIQFEKSTGLWILITGWIFIVVSILLNLASHQVSAYYINQTQKEVVQDLSDIERDEKNEKRNWVIRGINICSLGLLIFGISFILIFASVNATFHNKNQNENTDTLKVQITNLNQLSMPQEEKKTSIVSSAQPVQNPLPKIEKKGATVPRQNTSTPKPTSQPSKPSQTKK